MSRITGLLIWLIGLLGCSIPIVIIFAAHLFPDTGPASGVTLMDVARQTYPNILIMVMALGGIAIAEALMLFFRMVETGEAKATPALWLLCMVLLIVFSSISYAGVAGGEFNPARVSDQQLWMACAGATVAMVAALALRLSVLKFEQIAREAVHENAVVSTLEDIRQSQDDQLDLYDFSQYATNLPEKKDVEQAPAAGGDEAKPAEPLRELQKAPPAEIARPMTSAAAEAFAKVVPGPTLDEPEEEYEPEDPEKAEESRPPAPRKKAAVRAKAPEAKTSARRKDPEPAAPKSKAAADEPDDEEPENKVEIIRPSKKAEKKVEPDAQPASKSKAQNPRFTRRSSGTRIRKPRSKDAKV
ncbi:MAG: hypothetical protein AAF441_03135 [Pseudomonadota bacterium]